VTILRLGHGLTAPVAVLTDTHYCPINGPVPARWWTSSTARPDVVCHVGDIADGTPEQWAGQSAPLATSAPGASVFVSVWITRAEPLPRGSSATGVAVETSFIPASIGRWSTMSWLAWTT
jgi:hypothetical protein